MEAPSVRYTRSAVGSAIAWVKFGAGPPNIYVSSLPWSHVSAFWRIPGYPSMYEAIAARRTLVMYDARGSGLSDRDAADFSLDGRVADLEAVIEASGFDRLDISAATVEAGVATTFAARHPDRVRRLVLLDPVARGADYLDQPAIRALSTYREMLEEDWLGYLATLSARIVGFEHEHTDRVRALAGVLGEASSPKSLRALLASMPDFDASPSLPEIRCPALVMSFPEQMGAFPHLAREFVVKIAGAQSATIASPHRFPLSPEAIATMDAFLSEPD